MKDRWNARRSLVRCETQDTNDVAPGSCRAVLKCDTYVPQFNKEIIQRNWSVRELDEFAILNMFTPPEKFPVIASITVFITATHQWEGEKTWGVMFCFGLWCVLVGGLFYGCWRRPWWPNWWSEGVNRVNHRNQDTQKKTLRCGREK